VPDIALIMSAPLAVAAGGGGLGLLVTALFLGVRHGIDWDHIAAITDITSTTAASTAGEARHETEHRSIGGHVHEHGGPGELRAHDGGSAHDRGRSHDDVLAHDMGAQPARPSAGGSAALTVPASLAFDRGWFFTEQAQAILLGTLYALGHALVVGVLGLAALSFGAILPDWVDPIMGRVVGVTLVVLGIWVIYSLVQYARNGTEFRLQSRWMLVFRSVRYGWRWFQAKIHGHAHVEPVEMASYGRRTAFGVGMIHGIGAETGTQVLIIAAVGGAAGAGLGVPMLGAFILGLLISNTAIVILSATGFVASQMRTRIYLVVGAVAGVFSLVVGLLFLFDATGLLPQLDQIFGPT
jgi:high-affinity nickel-transport protein